MTSNLVEWVDSQLSSSGLPDDVALLVLAALEGDEQLDDYLADGTAVSRSETVAAGEDVVANGVVLTSITVEGFRGIGPKVTLPIAPKPGLTIVAGRNGSGKSSFSEALELVLTGRTYRWVNKSAEWREQWRNLHHATAKVSATFVEEGVGPIEVTARWADGEKAVESRTVHTQTAGAARVDGIDHLGWKTALEQFRPILSYDELGGMLDGKRSELYDALASILGVQQLGDAVKRLKARVAARRGPGQLAVARRRELQSQAAASGDERGVVAAGLLKKSAPDTAALRALATGGQHADTGLLHRLRTLATLSAPDPEEVRTALSRLLAARNALAEAGAEASRRNMDRLRLLEQGLALHDSHGDQTCPVCRTGKLDAGWHTTSRALVEHERSQFADIELAHQSFDLAFDALRKLIRSPQATLTSSPLPALAPVLEAAREAWAGWAAAPTRTDASGVDLLAAHVDLYLDGLVTATGALRDEAGAEIASLDDQWQPLASAIVVWCEQWEAWKEAEPAVTVLQDAHKWLTENDLRLKNERLAPIETGARDAWQKLRQESNVELGSLALAGSANRRRVQVSGAIDGEAVDSFAVFSQGELHALTLSLFLPRATLAQSPFRFVVLDDPVQAMDPAKVDGLVELLGELAATRQVVVFSHDDRLAAALRRSSYDATILEVTRGENSAVAVDVAQDPTTRYLADAHGLIKEWQHQKLTEDDLRRTLPGLFRFAIESAAVDRYFATQLAAGVNIHDLEREWTDTHTTKKRVNLAIFGQQPPDHVSASWANLVYRKAALGVAAGGFHQGLAGWVDPEDAHHNTKRLIADIRVGAR